jgi:hypothetical protein
MNQVLSYLLDQHIQILRNLRSEAYLNHSVSLMTKQRQCRQYASLHSCVCKPCCIVQSRASHHVGDIVPLDLRILRILLPMKKISDVRSQQAQRILHTRHNLYLCNTMRIP